MSSLSFLSGGLESGISLVSAKLRQFDEWNGLVDLCSTHSLADFQKDISNTSRVMKKNLCGVVFYAHPGLYNDIVSLQST